jgi:hypothetical protein
LRAPEPVGWKELMRRTWIVAAAVLALPACTIADVRVAPGDDRLVALLVGLL